MDASTDIPAWTPATTIPAGHLFLIWAEPLRRLCWYGAKQLPMVTADAAQWVHADGFVDIDILARTDHLVAEGHFVGTWSSRRFVTVGGCAGGGAFNTG
jgi:hypothetical protein